MSRSRAPRGQRDPGASPSDETPDQWMPIAWPGGTMGWFEVCEVKTSLMRESELIAAGRRKPPGTHKYLESDLT